MKVSSQEDQVMQVFHSITPECVNEIVYRESMWRLALDNSGQGVWDYNTETQKHFVSVGWKRMRGLDPDLPFSDSLESWHSRIHPEDLPNVIEQINRYHSGTVKHYAFEYREKRADGEWVWILAQGRIVELDKHGKPLRLLGVDIDITRLRLAEQDRSEKLQKAFRQHVLEIKRAHRETEAARRKADHLSRVDALSGLANRRAFTNRLEELVKSESEPFSVMLLDVDHFKQINGRFGHKVGDEVIIEVGKRLLKASGGGVFVARLGGDEFGLIVTNASEGAAFEARSFLARTYGELSCPFKAEANSIPLRGSIGVACFPAHGSSCSELLGRADLALYEAKALGRNQYVMYDDAIGFKAAREATLTSDLRMALERQEIVPFFQPIVDLRADCVVAMEVLARWNHPLLGLIGPEEFIPIAARLGLGELLTKAMLAQALRVAQSWPEDIVLSVNLSADEMCESACAQTFLGLLRECRFSPKRIQVEITEQALLKDTRTASKVISQLQRVGVVVLLDDFGKGFSGLCYLRELVLDGIKIDGSFSKGLKPGNQKWKVLTGILDLARSLSLSVILEGIEDMATVEACRKMGVRTGQGYHFARPMPADAVHGYLRRGDSTRRVSA